MVVTPDTQAAWASLLPQDGTSAPLWIAGVPIASYNTNLSPQQPQCVPVVSLARQETSQRAGVVGRAFQIGRFGLEEVAGETWNKSGQSRGGSLRTDRELKATEPLYPTAPFCHHCHLYIPAICILAFLGQFTFMAPSATSGM